MSLMHQSRIYPQMTGSCGCTWGMDALSPLSPILLSPQCHSRLPRALLLLLTHQRRKSPFCCSAWIELGMETMPRSRDSPNTRGWDTGGDPAPSPSAGDSGPGRGGSCSVSLVLFWGQRMALGQRLSRGQTRDEAGQAAGSSREPSQGDLVTGAGFVPIPPGTASAGLSRAAKAGKVYLVSSFSPFRADKAVLSPCPTSPKNGIKATPGYF